MAGAVDYNVLIMITAIATLLHMISNMVSCRPDMTVIYFHCSPEQYDASDRYKGNVVAVLQDVIANTPNSGYDYYGASSGPEQAFAHGACNGALSYNDCHACLGFTLPKILNGCPYAIGSTLQFKDCRMRYEDYPFVDEL